MAFIPFTGECQERLSFFFSTCIVTVNPHNAESASISGKLGRKRWGSSFRFTLLFTHMLLSPTYLWRSQWFIKIGRCHHADDTQSALWISLAPLHTSTLFFFFLSFLLVPSIRGSFRDSIFQKVIIIHEGSLSICGDSQNREWKCMLDCRFVFRYFQHKCTRILPGCKNERENKIVFLWLYLTLLCNGVHCISLRLQSVLCSALPPPLPLICIYQLLLG